MDLNFSSIVVLDANILYSAPLRDYLLSLADEELFRPKWTETIHEEWIRNLHENRPDIALDQLEKLKQAMNNAFPDANITNYKTFINKLSLPDTKDRHVLAAAVKADASIIVTCNLKDFPKKSLSPYNITALHPDDFILKIIESSGSGALSALNNQVKRLKNPPLTAADVLKAFEKVGLTKTSSALKGLL